MLYIYTHAKNCLELAVRPSEAAAAAGIAPDEATRADFTALDDAPEIADTDIAEIDTPADTPVADTPGGEAAGLGTPLREPDEAAGDEAVADAAATAGAEGGAAGAKPEAPAPRVVWYDLLRPTPDEVRAVETALGIVLPTREEMQEIEVSARLYHEDGAEFLTVTSISAVETDAPLKSPVTFVLKGGTLVTLRHADPRPFRSVSARMRKPNGAHGLYGETVMIELLEGMIDRLADLLEMAGDEIDRVSREVFRKKSGNVSKDTRDLESLISRIGSKAELLSLVRESLISISRLSTYHQAVTGEKRKHAKEAKLRMKSVQRDVTSLTDHSTFLSGKVNFMLDATLGLISLQQSGIIKIFSVAAVVFLPPTMIASIYGMNFEIMPELGWTFGYPFALGLMVMSAIGPYFYFKRRGWL